MQVMLVCIMLQMRKESEREWSVHMTTPLVDARLKAQTSCQPHSKVGAHFLKQNPLDKPPCSSRQKSYQGTGRTFACPVRHTTDFLTRLPSAACSLFPFFFFYLSHHVCFWYLLIIPSTETEHVFFHVEWICFWFLVRLLENYVFSILEIILKSSSRRVEIHGFFFFMFVSNRRKANSFISSSACASNL